MVGIPFSSTIHEANEDSASVTTLTSWFFNDFMSYSLQETTLLTWIDNPSLVDNSWLSTSTNS